MGGRSQNLKDAAKFGANSAPVLSTRNPNSRAGLAVTPNPNLEPGTVIFKLSLLAQHPTLTRRDGHSLRPDLARTLGFAWPGPSSW
jgi:hypothetical protein